MCRHHRRFAERDRACGGANAPSSPSNGHARPAHARAAGDATLAGRHSATIRPAAGGSTRRFRKAAAAAAPADALGLPDRLGQDRRLPAAAGSGRRRRMRRHRCRANGTRDPARSEQGRGDAAGDFALPDGRRDRRLGARGRRAVVEEIRPPLRALDNFASYECRGRNNVRAAQVERARPRRRARRARFQARRRPRIRPDRRRHVDKDWRDDHPQQAPARGSRPCSAPAPTAITRSTSISISNCAATITKSASGMCASRRRRSTRKHKDTAAGSRNARPSRGVRRPTEARSGADPDRRSAAAASASGGANRSRTAAPVIAARSGSKGYKCLRSAISPPATSKRWCILTSISRAFARPARSIIERGQGVYVYDTDGKPYIEGMAGLWCTALGYGNEELVEAAAAQMRKLSFAHLFTGRSHDPAIELAEKLKEIAPVPISKVFFCNSGSEANDTQVKLVWYLNNALGRPQKKEDHQPHQGLSRRHHRRGVADRTARQSSRFRPAAAGLSACRLPASLPLRAGRRERRGIRDAACRRARCADRQGRPRHRRRLHRRAGDGRRRRDRAAANLFRKNHGGLRASTTCS